MIIIAQLNSLTINNVTYDEFKTAVDTSLSVAGKAADAKAVGEALSKINTGGGSSGGSCDCGESIAILEQRVSDIEQGGGVVAEEQVLDFSEHLPANEAYVAKNLVLTKTVEAGKSYRVVWGDQEYICEAIATNSSASGAASWYMGNTAVLIPGAVANTNEPFFMAENSDGVQVSKRETDTNTTIAIYENYSATAKYVQQYVERYIGEALGGDY